MGFVPRTQLHGGWSSGGIGRGVATLRENNILPDGQNIPKAHPLSASIRNAAAVAHASTTPATCE